MEYLENDMQKIDEDIKTAIEGMSNKKRIEKLLSSANNECNSLRRKVSRLKERFELEQLDVDKLTKKSFTNFLHTILNNKVEKLNKEEREALEAKLKFELAENDLLQCEDSIKNLESEYKKYRFQDVTYNELILKKRKLIEKYFPDKRREIEICLKDKTVLDYKEKEIREAINAGNRVLKQLRKAKTSLNSAKNWGTWDMLGGGMITTMAKRDKMKQAQNYINRTQQLLRKFSRELKDVDKYIDIDLHIDSFLGFSDYFFDGFFVDYMVQTKIRSAQDKVDSVCFKVSKVTTKLKSEFESITSKKYIIDTKITNIIKAA